MVPSSSATAKDKSHLFPLGISSPLLHPANKRQHGFKKRIVKYLDDPTEPHSLYYYYYWCLYKAMLRKSLCKLCWMFRRGSLDSTITICLELNRCVCIHCDFLTISNSDFLKNASVVLMNDQDGVFICDTCELDLIAMILSRFFSIIVFFFKSLTAYLFHSSLLFLSVCRAARWVLFSLFYACQSHFYGPLVWLYAVVSSRKVTRVHRKRSVQNNMHNDFIKGRQFEQKWCDC